MNVADYREIQSAVLLKVRLIMKKRRLPQAALGNRAARPAPSTERGCSETKLHKRVL